MDGPQKTLTERQLLIAEYFMHKHALTTNLTPRQRHEAESGMETVEGKLDAGR